MASTKMKKKLKAVHQKVKLFRANEPLLSVFMWGINHSMNELSHVSIPVMLMPEDFKAYSKTRVDNHFFNKDTMPSHFKFKEYCPLVFRNLRERFGIDDNEYAYSLSKAQPMDAESPGRSGARFLQSYDRRFVIKTLVSEEVAEMHHILKAYHQHIVERHADTLLPQYLGMYRITVNDNETYLVVMRNIFSPRLTVHKKYDLKGSTVDRQASDKEKRSQLKKKYSWPPFVSQKCQFPTTSQAKDLPTYKDNDFVNDGMKLAIGDEAKDKLMDTLTADVEFLMGLNLMDYSLLVGIHDMDKAEDELEDSVEEENGAIEEDEDSTGSAGGGAMPTPPDSPMGYTPAPFTGEIDNKLEPFAITCIESKSDAPRREIYFMALIDILTHFGVKKRTAQAAKTVKHGAGAEISTVRPEQYGKRFLEFIERVLS